MLRTVSTAHLHGPVHRAQYTVHRGASRVHQLRAGRVQGIPLGSLRGMAFRRLVCAQAQQAVCAATTHQHPAHPSTSLLTPHPAAAAILLPHTLTPHTTDTHY